MGDIIINAHRKVVSGSGFTQVGKNTATMAGVNSFEDKP